MIEIEVIRRILTSVRSALRGIRSAPLVFVISVTTLSAGLLLLGTYLLIVQNMRGVLENFGQDLKLVAFLDEGATDVDAMKHTLSELSGVQAVLYVSNDTALVRLREDLGRDADVLDGLDRNPLPSSFELSLGPELREEGSLRVFAKQVEGMPGINETRYGEDWVQSYGRILRAMEWLGLGLGVFLMLILGTVIAGTVRLAVYSRNDEIAIQRLVGAGGVFVRLPFYIEGAIQGGVAAAVAISLLYALFGLGLPVLGDILVFLLGKPVPDFFGRQEMLALVLVGISLGVGGAMLSLLRLEERT